LTQVERTNVPTAWKDDVEAQDVEVLPLADGPAGSFRSGWCTYTYEHAQAPELEVICGGINDKTPRAGAVWRQGHLLHFGFEQSPAELNENGRALLINSICYIAKFTDDRPIVRTPSIFYSRVRLFDRSVVLRLVDNPARDLQQYLDYYLSAAIRSDTQGMDREGVREWFEEVQPFLHADQDGKLTIDKSAQAFGAAPNQPEFFIRAVQALRNSEESAGTARELLARYAPAGPQGGDADAWDTWWRENREHAFFSDTGGFCWYIDPLAKSRGIPTQDLRGPARAGSFGAR
jgi:hypothetical protein